MRPSPPPDGSRVPDPFVDDQDSVRKAGWRRVWLTVLVLCAILVVTYVQRIADLIQVHAEIAVAQEEVEDTRQWQLELQAEWEYVQSDEYVARKALEEMNMSRPGDEVYVILDEEPREPAAEAQAALPPAETSSPVPFSQAWWSSLLR
jgi:cell division protein FtsB